MAGIITVPSTKLIARLLINFTERPKKERDTLLCVRAAN